MTMVNCMGCGCDIYFADLKWCSEREQDYAGLCRDCFYEEMEEFIGDNISKFGTLLEAKYKDKITQILKDNCSKVEEQTTIR